MKQRKLTEEERIQRAEAIIAQRERSLKLAQEARRRSLEARKAQLQKEYEVTQGDKHRLEKLLLIRKLLSMQPPKDAVWRVTNGNYQAD